MDSKEAQPGPDPETLAAALIKKWQPLIEDYKKSVGTKPELLAKQALMEDYLRDPQQRERKRGEQAVSEGVARKITRYCAGGCGKRDEAYDYDDPNYGLDLPAWAHSMIRTVSRAQQVYTCSPDCRWVHEFREYQDGHRLIMPGPIDRPGLGRIHFLDLISKKAKKANASHPEVPDDSGKAGGSQGL